MKKLLIAACLTCALAIAANAAEGDDTKKAAPGQDQKAVRKELTEKYDTDKNGKLNKEEKAKMTPEDLEKWTKASPPKKEKAAEGSEGKPKKAAKE